MVTRSKKRKFTGSKKNRFIGKPTGQIQKRVQAVGAEHFGIISVDCAKRRSKWMLCNFYGKVIIEPTTVEHTTGGLRAMTQLVVEACKTEGLTDTIAAIEMTGIYHKPAAYAAEAQPLQELARKRNRGPQRIGDLLIPPDIQNFPNSTIRFVDVNRPGVIQP